MGMDANNEIIDEAFQGREARACFSNDADVSSPSGSAARNGGRNSSSDISNFLSACSSNDSLSEIAESKADSKASKIEMPVQVDASQTVADMHCSHKALISYDQIISNQAEKQKESECLVDTISCMSGLENINMIVGEYNSDVDKKNVSSSSASDISFSATETTVKIQLASSCLVPFGKLESNGCKSSNEFTKDCLQATAVHSFKSDLSESSSARDFHVGTSSLKGKNSEFSDEQVESLLKTPPMLGIGGQRGDTGFVKPATQMRAGDLPAEARKFADERELVGKSNMVVEEHNKQEISLKLQPVHPGGVSDTLEYEVRVCDTCGDIGQEQFLAICSTCADGAAHTYCMRVKLDAVPEGDWMCEECELSEDAEKHKLQKFDPRVSEVPSLKGTKLDFTTSGAFRYKRSLELDIKDSAAETSRTTGLNCKPDFSNDRPLGNYVSVAKQKAFQTSFESPRASASGNKNLMCVDSSSKSLDKGKTELTNEVTSRNSFSNSALMDKHLPTIPVGKSPKLHQRCPMPQGPLRKSQSVNLRDSRKQFKIPEEGGSQKQFKLPSGSGKREESVKLRKSLSFNDASYDRINASGTEVTKLSSNLSHDKGLKRLRHAEELGSIKTEFRLKFCYPSVAPEAIDSGSITPIADKMLAPPGQKKLSSFSGSSNHDLNGDKGHVKPSNFSKSTSHLTKRGSLEKEQNRTAGGAFAVEENYSNATLHPDDRPLLGDLPSRASALAISSRVSAVPQHDCIWKGEFEIKKRGRLPKICHGIQAHLSTVASPKVLEIVEKLPQNILLEEVSCSRAWPIQFMENQATEDNIGLYFFANDLNSYERSYGRLLKSMKRNNFALRGNFDGVELLVFSSILLPEKSQRWNNMLFLWGIFRGGRAICSEIMPNLQNGSSGTFEEFFDSKVSSPEHKSTSLNHQLSNVDTAARNELPSRDVLHADSFQEGGRHGKRSWEIDLNCYDLSVDEEYACKKMKKTCDGDAKDLEVGFSYGSKFSGKVGGSSGTSDTSKIYTDLGSSDGCVGLKFLQRSSTNSKSWFESRVSKVEFPMGLGENTALQEPMSQDERSKSLSNLEMNDEDVDGASTLLSLSLALPSIPIEEPVMQQPKTQTKLLLPEWRDFIGHSL